MRAGWERHGWAPSAQGDTDTQYPPWAREAEGTQTHRQTERHTDVPREACTLGGGRPRRPHGNSPVGGARLGRPLPSPRQPPRGWWKGHAALAPPRPASRPPAPPPPLGRWRTAGQVQRSRKGKRPRRLPAAAEGIGSPGAPAARPAPGICRWEGGGGLPSPSAGRDGAGPGRAGRSALSPQGRPWPSPRPTLRGAGSTRFPRPSRCQSGLPRRSQAGLGLPAEAAVLFSVSFSPLFEAGKGRTPLTED